MNELETKLNSLLKLKEDFKLRKHLMDKDSRRKEDQRLRKAIQIARDRLGQPVHPERLEKIQQKQGSQTQAKQQRQVKKETKQKAQRQATSRHTDRKTNAETKRVAAKTKRRSVRERKLKRGPAVENLDQVLDDLAAADDVKYETQRKKKNAKAVGKRRKVKRMHQALIDADIEPGTPFAEIRSETNGGAIINHTVKNRGHTRIDKFLNDIRPIAEQILTDSIPSKTVPRISCVFVKLSTEETEEKYMSLPAYVVNNPNNVTAIYTDMINELMNKTYYTEIEGSGWGIERIIGLELSVHKYEPDVGPYDGEDQEVGCLRTLPQWLQNKRCVINPQNGNGNKMCFRYAIGASCAKPDAKDVGRWIKPLDTLANKYKFQNENGSEKITYPATMKDFKLFEKFNPNVRLLVYILRPDTKKNGTTVVRPVHERIQCLFNSGKNPKKTNMIRLLAVDDHICFLKNMSALLSKGNGHMHHLCENCGNTCSTEVALKSHKKMCEEHEPQNLTFPKEDSYIKFKKYGASNKSKLVLHVDFESSLNEPKPEEHHQLVKLKFNLKAKLEELERLALEDEIKKLEAQLELKQKIKKTAELKSQLKEKLKDLNFKRTNVIKLPPKAPKKAYQEHKPTGVSIQVVRFDKLVKCIRHTGEDAAKVLVETVERIVRDFYDEFKDKKPIIIDQETLDEHNKKTNCYLCEKKFSSEDPKVKDHDHFTGLYRGAAHNRCNLLLRAQTFVPVYAHGMMSYDEKLFIRELTATDGKLKCLARNEENLITFSKTIPVAKYMDTTGKKPVEKTITRTIKYLDSFAFLPSSLAQLTKDMNPEDFVFTKQEFPEHIDLMMRKGVYPYDFVSSFEKLSHPKLPDKEDFYSKLHEQDISDEDYEHAQKVWETFKCKTLKDYHDIYLALDTCLLADAFEKFRNMSLKNYGLDPTHYVSLPGLAMDAMLKTTKISLEMLHDPEMFLMIEDAKRGGFAAITHRHAKANNKYLKNYDPKIKSSYIVDLDENSMYCGAMMDNLPHSGFKWANADELNKWSTVTDQKGVGMFLKVDLTYPENLHDAHNAFPLAPEGKSRGFNKLEANLYDKKEYTLHYKALKYYLSKGLILTKVHSAIKFKESKWMKSYIELNARLRAEATSDFGIKFFKNMSNIVFGKTIENVRKRVNIELAVTYNDVLKNTRKVTFQGSKYIDDNLTIIRHAKWRSVATKPIYVGVAILDLSKISIAKFHYDYFMKKFPNAILIFTDTDSLCYHVETEDIYVDIIPDVHKHFDTSNFPKNHPSGIPTNVNRKVVCKMKFEFPKDPIVEIVGLRPKLYCGLTNKDVEIMRSKGITEAAKKKHLTMQKYLDCLRSGKHVNVNMNVIRSKNHTMYTESVNKIGLSANDDKRYICADGIKTLAWGHKDIPK